MTTVEPHPDQLDHERVTIEGETVGGPVDQPQPAPPLSDRLRAYAAAHRPPILRRWWGSLCTTVTALRKALVAFLLDTVRHVEHSPRYVWRVLWWSPRGAWLVTKRLGRWIADVDGRVTRDDTTLASNPEAHRRLSELHDSHVKHRLIGLAVGVPLTAAAALILWFTVPRWALATVGAVTLLVLARIGRPTDRRITDRVRTGPAYTRLTAEMVRGALVNLGIGIKDPASLTFPRDIHRDGPGQTAVVNLPPGVEAVKVVTARRRLSSAMRLPLDQVWPAVGDDHEGQLSLWVGYEPTSKMRQPRWSITAENAQVSVFEPIDIGTDQRQRPIATPLIARNFLIGGVPGSGKSYAARALALGAALDPTVELKIAELKGTADFGDLAPLCSTYVCGIDDVSLEEAGGIFQWGLAEAARRAERIRKAREKGQAPEGKVTPELARTPGSGLHPVLIVIDEAHELLGEKGVADAAERLIKRGRALGIVVVLATQIPDKDSVPTSITKCVTMRWCLAVQDQVANDQILGTGAYKRGVTSMHYIPERDAGWGILTGLGQPAHVRSYFSDAETTAAIIRRARQLRGDRVVGGGDTTPDRDPLGDALRMFELARTDRMHWATLTDMLLEHMPDRYAGETQPSIAAMMRALGVAEEPVSVSGNKQRGCRLASVRKAAEHRAEQGQRGS